MQRLTAHIIIALLTFSIGIISAKHWSVPQTLNLLMPLDQNVEGTTWSGIDVTGGFTVYEFLKGGKLRCTRYEHPLYVWETASWKQDGDFVYLEMNNRYAEYRGVVKGNQIEGFASNIKNEKWRWQLYKQPAIVTAVAPGYPREAIAEKIEYSYEWALKVDAQGVPVSATYTVSHVLLEDAMREAAMKWRFAPSMRGEGERIVRIIFTYRLMPRGTSESELAPVFKSPFEIEIRAAELSSKH